MTSAVDTLNKDAGIPKSVFPVLGGLTVGIIALVYPEVLYWGFENVDILLESRPFVKGLSADLLLQLVAVKIAATALCRASGLVGGYYAPSLFIGGAAGMAYGKFIGIALAQNPGIHLSILEVASPQAYGLVLFLHGQCFIQSLLFFFGLVLIADDSVRLIVLFYRLEWLLHLRGFVKFLLHRYCCYLNLHKTIV